MFSEILDEFAMAAPKEVVDTRTVKTLSDGTPEVSSSSFL
jgi:hypothetical protein